MTHPEDRDNEAASMWRDLARMEAEVVDPEEEATLVYSSDDVKKVRDAYLARMKAKGRPSAILPEPKAKRRAGAEPAGGDEEPAVPSLRPPEEEVTETATLDPSRMSAPGDSLAGTAPEGPSSLAGVVTPTSRSQADLDRELAALVADSHSPRRLVWPYVVFVVLVVAFLVVLGTR